MLNEYIKFTEEEKERANEIDLVDYLEKQGVKLIRAGRDMRIEDNKSITLRGNRWYDHSTEKGGYAIDFMKYFYEMNFQESVQALIGNSVNYMVYTPKYQPPKEFKLPKVNESPNRLFAYLTSTRKINPSITSFFVMNNLIYESKEMNKEGLKEYQNLVFVGFDENGEPKHAHKRSMYSQGNKFVQNVEGGNPKNTFNYRGGSNRLYVFEAPIDMLSFISMHRDKNWKAHNFVAMCGISSQPMFELIEKNSNINHVVLCLDNDDAGNKASERFAKELAEMNIKTNRCLPENKDFNEDLLESFNQVQSGLALGMG